MEKRNEHTEAQGVKDALDFPGVATNRADDNKTTPCMVKEDVKELNNNPRNTDADMPGK